MPLIKDGLLAEDSWVHVDDEAELSADVRPADKHPIVSLERWQAEHETLRQRNAPLGIRLKSDQSPAEIADDIGHFAVIALDFPKFTDGRAYSSARLLRERYGYKGELRAVGNVLRDQFLFMQRCGFDSFEVKDAKAAEAWAESIAAISVSYQPGADARRPAIALRHRRQQTAPAVDKGAAEEPAPATKARTQTPLDSGYAVTFGRTEPELAAHGAD